MLLKKDYDTDAEEDEAGSTSTGESDSDGEESLDPNSNAYKKLPAAVKKQLENLSGQVESLYDENKKLKEVSAFELCKHYLLLVPTLCLGRSVKSMTLLHNTYVNFVGVVRAARV